ncbi:Bacterial hemoglobin [Rhodobacteraceae bacterium THAF1]|uniref:globin domain-containing protein n=1 Tax=Palleronia sp. THAF1 TaxID=2587842 RepID=UPI000F3D41F9|nr:globin domain-containing protein [Palleronia sp. THAF1]QFU08271.1 Bacterial hemoglobin [Palleronia sp. THAF1]VDC28853.1 Bacterial hemoglobin [Rhodobacteraceae bacterium THAF1]
MNTDLITSSYTRVFNKRGTVSRSFYDKLFTDAPELRALFPPDMQRQRDKFDKLLMLIVAQLSKPDRMIATIEDLGRRHYHYGAQRAHIPLVGATLIAALRASVPGGLSVTEEAAWGDLYLRLADAFVVGLDAAEAEDQLAGRVTLERPF